jgi:hypothetical protein
MANLRKKSVLKILKTDIVALIQQHYPTLYSRLSSTTIDNMVVDNDSLRIEFSDADDGSQLN